MDNSMLRLFLLNTLASGIVCTTQSKNYDVYFLLVWMEILTLVALGFELVQQQYLLEHYLLHWYY